MIFAGTTVPTRDETIYVVIASSDGWSYIHDTMEARTADLEARYIEIMKAVNEINNPPLWRQDHSYLSPRSFRSQCAGKPLISRCRT